MNLKELEKLQYKIYAILQEDYKGNWVKATDIVRMLDIEYDVRLVK